MSQESVSEMQVTREDLNPCTIQLTVVCSPSQVEDGFERALRKFAKQVRVPGFRPGTAPKAVIRQSVDPNQLAEAAAEIIVSRAFDQALKQEDLKPENRPAINLTKFSPTECEFIVKVPLAPKVVLGPYKGLHAQLAESTVTDEDVERVIAQLRERAGKREAVTERGVVEGDYAVVRVEPAEEGSEGRSFMVVAGKTFPEFDAALVGMTVEEMKSLSLTFPPTFQEKDWAGKTLDCQLTVRSVTSLKLPELDEAFAKEQHATDVEDLKAKVRTRLEYANVQVQNEMLDEQLLEGIVSKSEIHVADTTWESVAQQKMEELARELRQQNTTLEQYAERQGMTLEQLHEALQKEAQVYVRRAVVIENIFREEKLEISDQQAREFFLQIAYENQIQAKDVKKFMKDHGAAVRSDIVYRAMFANVMKLVRDHAVIADAPGMRISG